MTIWVNHTSHEYCMYVLYAEHNWYAVMRVQLSGEVCIHESLEQG